MEAILRSFLLSPKRFQRRLGNHRPFFPMVAVSHNFSRGMLRSRLISLGELSVSNVLIIDLLRCLELRLPVGWFTWLGHRIRPSSLISLSRFSQSIKLLYHCTVYAVGSSPLISPLISALRTSQMPIVISWCALNGNVSLIFWNET